MSTATARNHSHLLLFTEVFPHGAGEAFLEAELAHLAGAFRHVTIVPRRTTAGTRELPANVTVNDELAHRHDARSKARSLRQALTSRHFHRELVRRPATLRQPAAANHLVGQMAAAVRVRDWIQEQVASGSLDLTDTTIYTYWLWCETVGAGLLREVHPDIRLVSRAHGFDVYAERHDPQYVPLQRFAIEAVDKLFVVSEHGRQYLSARYPQFASRIELSRLGTADPGGCSTRSTDGVLRVLTCARVEEVKRMPMVVHGLVALASRWPRQQVEWVHLGGGAGLDALRRQAERELPDTVHATFSGEVPNARVREHYLVSPVDVLLNVSSSEGVPVSMMEALSFGVPVVGTSVGGVPEIVNADTGILLPPDPAPEQIAAALYQFADRSGVVATMRRAARKQWCTRFDGERNFGEFVRRLSREVST